MENIPTELIQFGLEGAAFYLVLKLFQQNKALLERLRQKDEQIMEELGSRDDRLMNLIQHLVRFQNSDILPP